jgi:hypothetical protein
LNNPEKNYCQGRVAGTHDRELTNAAKSLFGRAQSSAEISLMAPVSDVPDVSRQEVTVRARHRFSLEASFQRQKGTSKLLSNGFHGTLYCQIKKLPWTDQG